MIKSNRSLRDDSRSSSSRLPRRQHKPDSVWRFLQAGAERLEVRLMLTATCPDDITEYTAGDYTPSEEKDVIVDEALCYTGDITIKGNDSLTVTADIISSGGEVTLELSHKLPNFDISALDQVADFFSSLVHEAKINIGSDSTDDAEATPVRISGYDGVSITADAGVNNNETWDSIKSFGVSNLAPVIMEALEVPDLFTLPVAIQVWKPNAQIALENAHVVSEQGEVEIEAESTAIASGKAVWNRVLCNSNAEEHHAGGDADQNQAEGEEGAEVNPQGQSLCSPKEGLDARDKFAFAIGAFYTDAVAIVDLQNAIVSGTEVVITSDVENEIELEVTALKNNGISKTNPKAVSAAVGWADQQTQSKVYVDKDSFISSVGNVEISAEAKGDSGNHVKAVAYRDGLVGAAFSWSSADATVSAVVDGNVTSRVPTPEEGTEGGDATELEPVGFNPAFQVDFESNSVSLPGETNFETGDAIILTSSNFGTIPGLTPGNLYYLIVPESNEADAYSLQFAQTFEDAINGEAISLGAAFPTLTKAGSDVPIPVTLTSIDAEQQAYVLFGYDTTPDGEPLFTDGESVTFNSSSDRFLGYLDSEGQVLSLLEGEKYTVKVVDPPADEFAFAIQLLDSTATPLVLTSASYLLNPETNATYPISGYDLNSGEVDLGVASLDFSGETVTSLPPATPIFQGTELQFFAGLNPEVTSLENQSDYYAIVDRNTPWSTLSSNADGGTFTLNIQGANESEGTTDALNWDVSADDLEQAINDLNLTGVIASVRGAGQTDSPWVIEGIAASSIQTDGENLASTDGTVEMQVEQSWSGQIRLAASQGQAAAADPKVQAASPSLTVNDQDITLPIGTFETGVGLVFSEDPKLSDNTAVTYHAVEGKPMAGLTDGNTYYAFNVNNTNANSAVPQYILTLTDSADTSPDILLGSEASSGSFTLTVQVANQPSATTSGLAWNASSQDVATAINGLALSGVNVTVSGTGQLSDPWEIQGLNPSQLNVDSSQLLDSSEQQTNMQMTSANQVSFGYGQSLVDPSSGAEFDIVNADMDGGQVFISLNDSADVTSVDSSNLVDGEAVYSSVAAGATQLFSFANGGTFTLTVTDDNGDPMTSGPLAWNIAPEDLASSLNDLLGVDSISVTGRGEFVSPWLIANLSQGSLSTDSSQLTKNGSSTNMLQRATPAPVQLVSTDASGGTFTLTLTASNASVTTDPIEYDASAAEVQSAIQNLGGVNSQVTGVGTSDDPWVLMASSQPFETGDPVTFQDSWDLPGMGLQNGDTYYAVMPGDSLDAQTVVVGLAASAEDANSTPPKLLDMRPYIPLNATPAEFMPGGTVTLSPVEDPIGITIKSEMDSSNSAGATATLGKFPLLAYYLKGVKNWSADAGKGENYKSFIDREITEKTPEELRDKSNQFEVSLAVAIQDVSNDVQATIGSTAEIGSEGDVVLESSLTESVNTFVEAVLAKGNTKKDGAGVESDKTEGAVAVALAMAFVDNSSQAVVESDAVVTAVDKLEISSEIEYEPPWSSWENADASGIASNVISTVKDLAFGDVKVLSMVFNMAADVGLVQAKKEMDFVITGSFTVETINNTNLAQIADGAQINQQLIFDQWDAQSSSIVTAQDFILSEANAVTVQADTTVEQIGLAGQLYFSMAQLYTGFKKGDFFSVLSPFQNTARNAFGGSVDFFEMTESTNAWLGGSDPEGNAPSNSSTDVTYGSGGLNITAESESTIVQIGQSAANSSGLGIEASLTYLLMGESGKSDAHRGKTVGAQIITEILPVNLDAVGDTSGAVNVSAEDTSDLWAVSGAVLLGTTKGIGISASTVEFSRDVVATVGSQAKGGNAKTSSLNSPGDFTIEAVSAGTIVPLSIVGSISGRDPDLGGKPGGNDVPAEENKDAANGIEGKWGLGISGDFAGAFVDDQTYAYLNDLGSVVGSQSAEDEFNTLEISSSNETILNPVAGQAAISLAGGNEKSLAGIAGSAAVADVTADVQALLENATIQTFALELEALNDKKIGTCAAGLQVATPKGADLQIAGSVVVNEITNTTIAKISKLQATDDIGEISLTALSMDEIWGAAGTAAVTWDRRSLKEGEEGLDAKTVVGVGMSAVWNHVENTTTAEVTQSTITQSDGQVTIAAEDFTDSRVLSAGVDVTVPAGTNVEIGGMWATNLLYPTTTAQITDGSVINSNSENTEPLLVTAVLAPVLQSFAGYFSLDIGKPLSEKEAQLGIGVGAAVVVTRLGDEDGSSATLAQINESTVTRSGQVTTQAYTGALNSDTEKYVPDQSEAADFTEDMNVHALAIAGSAQGEASDDSSFSAGIVLNGAVVVTDLNIATKALVTNGSDITTAENGSQDQVFVVASNQLISQTDAGGASISGAASVTGTSVDIAIGGADNTFNSSSQTLAAVETSDVTAEALNVLAFLVPEFTNDAFGVAVSVAFSTGSFAGAFGLSGASMQADISDTAEAGISNSNIDVTGNVFVWADDKTELSTGSGSGSLQVSISGDASVALAPSAVKNSVSMGNQVLGWIGSKPSTDRLVDAPNTDTSMVYAGGSIDVQATSRQSVTNTAVAVAVSVALAPYFDSAALSGSGASSEVTTNNIIKASVNDVESLAMSGFDGLVVSADRMGEVNASVGSGAASVGWFGGSIGVSLAQIKNKDQITAEIENSEIKTGASGTPVVVGATDSVELNALSVATSLSISIGAAGAGGNSNIYSSSKVVADVGQGTTITPLSGNTYGDLTVEATGQENIDAQIYGGSAGVGSVGVFLSETERDGLVRAGIGSVGEEFKVANLSVDADSNHNVTTHGYSVTIGGLAGSGETHTVIYTDSVAACLGVDFATATEGTCNGSDSTDASRNLQASGNFALSASADTTTSASDTGNPGTDQEGYNIGGLGVGIFQTNSTYSPVVNTVATALDLNAAGSLDFEAIAEGQSRSRALSGSGGIIAGDASIANNTIQPQATLIFDEFSVETTESAAVTSVLAQTNVNYDTYADAIQASIAGGSGAKVNNTFGPTANIEWQGTSSLTTASAITVLANNTLERVPDPDDAKISKNNVYESYNTVRGGSGGVVEGSGASAVTQYDGTAKINMGMESTDTAQIISNSESPSNVSVLATQQIKSQDFVTQDVGGVVPLAYSINDLTIALDTSVATNNATVEMTGDLVIGTAVDVMTISECVARSQGAGTANTSTSVEVTSNETILIQAPTASKLTANNVTVAAGGNLVPFDSSFYPQISSGALSFSHGLAHPSTASVSVSQDHKITIDENVSILATLEDVRIDATPESAGDSFSQHAGATRAHIPSGKMRVDSVLPTQTTTVTIDGTVIAVSPNMTIDFNSFPDDGSLASLQVNCEEGDSNNCNFSIPIETDFVDQLIAPPFRDSLNEYFVAFSAAANSDANVDESDLAPATKQFIEQNKLLPDTFPAIRFSEILVPQGSIMVIGDSLLGSGTLTTNIPDLNINNPTDAWLILDGVSGMNNLEAPDILTYKVSGETYGNVPFTQNESPNQESSINVQLTGGDLEGPSPGIVVTGFFNTPMSDVTLSNDYGPIIELAPINAASITIESPNAAFAVDTPNSYYGSGGDIQDAFEESAKANSGNTAGTQPVSYPFIPGQTQSSPLGWEASRVQETATEYLDGDSSPSVPLNSEGQDIAYQAYITGGLTAAQVAINAKTIDINAPLNVGKPRALAIAFGEELGQTLTNYQQKYQAKDVTNPVYLIDPAEFGVDASDISATYDARTNEITLAAFAASARVGVLLEGQIVSTMSDALINMVGGVSIVSVENNSGIPLVLDGIDAGATEVTGIVELRDKLQQQTTRYVYHPDQGVEVYTAPLGQSIPDTPDLVQTELTMEYQPLKDSIFSSYEQQQVFESMVVDGQDPAWTKGDPWKPANWSYGDVLTTGFEDFELVGGTVTRFYSGEVDVLQLTTGEDNEQNAAWFNESVDVAKDFVATFTYNPTKGGSKHPADGITFAVQTQGTDIVGDPGGSLGYVGIPGNKVSYQFNLYDNKNGPTPGTKYVQGNSSGSYDQPGELTIGLGKPTDVVIYYYSGQDPTLYVYLSQDGSYVYSEEHSIDLSNYLEGESAYVGFTGGTGNDNSTQQLSNFVLASSPSYVPTSTEVTSDLTTVLIDSFAGFSPVGTSTYTPVADIDSVELTNGDGDIATASWFYRKVDVTQDFEVTYVYTPSGDIAADGITLAWQNEGTSALGQTGGYLGYVGIPGNKAAYQMNLYDGHTVGTNFVTDNSSMEYNTTGAVNINSGSPIKVQLSYDAVANTMSERLLDMTSGALFDTVYGEVDLAGLLGNSAYIGFTGGSGGATAVQTVSDFSLSGVPIPDDFVQFVDAEKYGNELGYEVGLTTQIKADHLIEIDFSAMRVGNLLVGSDADLVLNGPIRFAGDTQLTSGGSISASSTGSVAGRNVFLASGGNADAIGSADHPINVTVDGGSLTALGIEGVYVSSPDDLSVDMVAAEKLLAAFSDGDQQWSEVNATEPMAEFDGMLLLGDAVLSSGDESLTLTSNDYSQVSAAWLPVQYPTENFTISFTYTASGERAADGVALVWQNEGTSAIGQGGGLLGYVGIGGNTAAYQMNLYDYHTIGTNFVMTNTSTDYNPTGSVEINSGNPIEVTLEYDVVQQLLTETLVDTVTQQEFNTTYDNVRLPSLLGESSWLGFTGGTGAAISTQVITDFTYQSDLPILEGPDVLLTSKKFDQLQTAAVWRNQEVNLGGPFATEFVYQASGDSLQGGAAFVLQDSGAGAIGDSSSSTYLGYGGMSGLSAAYEINLDSDLTVGSAFVTNGSVGSYQSTGDVDFASGHPILVRLTYDPASSVVLESLTDLKTDASWQATHSINLETFFGTDVAYIGFTASANGTVEQRIRDFLMTSFRTSVGSVELTSEESIIPETADSVIRAGYLTLEANGGTVGSAAIPLVVQMNEQPLQNGTVEGGVVNAVAPDGIFIEQPEGDLRIGQISSEQDVFITTLDGNVLDGLTLDSSQLNLRALLPETRERILSFLSDSQVDYAEENVSAFTAGINSHYSQYWSLVPGATVIGFDEFVPTGEGGYVPAAEDESVELTNGDPNIATASWLGREISTSLGFTAEFTYTASGNRAADGIAMVFQGDGINALGNSGDALGYVGISGANAAYQMNLNDEYTVGTNFVITDTSTEYRSTGAIDLDSGDPIQVRIVYDPSAATIQEFLTNSTTGESYECLHESVDLGGLLGPTTYFGFTGASGDTTAIQVVSDFQLTFVSVEPESDRFDQFLPVGLESSTPTITSDSIELTNGGVDVAAAAWMDQQISTQVGFSVEFTYTPSGDRAADGIAMVLQTQGTDVVGQVGGSLGYVGIEGPTAAYQMNLDDLYTIGTNFVTDNTAYDYNSTGALAINSGNPIKVGLVYDPVKETITETLVDSVENISLQRVYTGVNLEQLFGSDAYFGFTGSSGDETAIQTISEFKFSYPGPSPVARWAIWDPGYWGAIETTTDSDGTPEQTYQLTSEGIAALTPVYAAASGQAADNTTDDQVQSWANRTWQQAIAAFGNNYVFGADWASQSQFELYDSAYTFTASEAAKTAIANASDPLGDVVEFVSEEALMRPSEEAGLTQQVNIEADTLNIESSGAIGLYQAAYQISINDFDSGLSAAQKEILRVASLPGEIQLVGLNADGQTVYYDYTAGMTAPNGVTPTALQIEYSRPLRADVSNASMNAQGDVIFKGTGDTTYLENVTASDQGSVKIESLGSILPTQVEQPLVTGRDVELIAADGAGSEQQPLWIRANGTFDARTAGDLYLQTEQSLNLGQVDVKNGATFDLQVLEANSITDSFASERESISGFSSDGLTWIQQAKNGTARVNNNSLQMTNIGTSSTETTSAFASEVVYATEQAVPLRDSVTIGFLYSSANIGGRWVFSLQNETQPGLALVVQLSDSSNVEQWAEFVDVDEVVDVQAGQSLGTVDMNSGHLIKVLLEYSFSRRKVTATFTDTTTLDTAAISKEGINLFNRIGGPTGQISFATLSNSEYTTVQSFADFGLIDGPPNLVGGALTANVGGDFGEAGAPIVISMSGEINIDAAGDVYIEQISEDLNVGTINGQEISIDVIGGGITTYPDSFGASAEGETQNADISATVLTLNAPLGIGVIGDALSVSTGQLFGTTSFGDIGIVTQALDGEDGVLVSHLSAGGSIDLTGVGKLILDGDVVCGLDLGQECSLALRAITAADNLVGSGLLQLSPQANINAEGGTLKLFADEQLLAFEDSLLRAGTSINLQTGAADKRSADQDQVHLAGGIHASELRARAGSSGQSVKLATADLLSVEGSGAFPVFLEQFEGLHLDDSRSTVGSALQLGQRQLKSDTVEIHLDDVESLVLDLGLGDDSVVTADQTGVTSLEVSDSGGHNQYHLGLQEATLKHVSIDSASGGDHLRLNGRGNMLWVTEDGVESGYTHVDFKGIANLVLDNLESGTVAGILNKIDLEVATDLDDKLLLVGTGERDAVEVVAGEQNLEVQTISSGNERRRKTFSTSDITQLDLFLLSGPDVVRVSGDELAQVTPLKLNIHSGRDNDWITAQSVSVKITDVHGDNVITTGSGADEIITGPGDDDINAGNGVNVIRDAGGINRIMTGLQDDEIHHSNTDDWIFASEGVNRIWLNGEQQGWHNRVLHADVDRDGTVAPFDALAVINLLNNKGSHPLLGSADTVSMLYDTNDDQYLSPIDALRVINFLNQQEAEGEPANAVALVSEATDQTSRVADACFAHWDEEDPGSVVDEILVDDEAAATVYGPALPAAPHYLFEDDFLSRWKRRPYYG